MGNTTRIILFAAGFLLTVALIAVGVNVYQKGKTTIDNATTQYDSTMGKYDNASYTQLDGTNVPGSTVIELVKALENDTTGVEIQVKNKTATKRYMRTQPAGDTAVIAYNATMIQNIQKKTVNSGTYINPSAQFSCKVTKNDNGVVSLVYFEQQTK